MVSRFLKKAIDLYHFNKRSFVMFCVVGILNVTIYVGLYAFFDKVIKLGNIFALTLSFILAASFQFTANRFFSFQAGGRRYTKDILKYCILLLVNYLISVLVVYVATWINQPPIYGILAISGFCPFLNYVLFRYWKFPSVLSENVRMTN